MLRNSFSVYPRGVKTKHRSQFLSYDHQNFFWANLKRFLRSHRFDFFNFLLYFWKNRFFVKFFVFDIKENILLHFEHQILDVKTWILPWKSIQKIQYLSYCHQFFCGESFGSIKRNGNCIYTLIVWKLWKIEYFDDCVYVKYSRIFYCIFHYTPQKIDICGQKMYFFKNEAKNAKNRNGETFKSILRYPQKNLKVVE